MIKNQNDIKIENKKEVIIDLIAVNKDYRKLMKAIDKKKENK